MTDDPFDARRAQFRHDLEEFRRVMAAELDAARQRMRTAVDLARAEREAARFQLELKVAEFRSGIAGFQEEWRGKPRRRRPPRGGSPVPVSPGPRPTPRVGGAEAPID